MAEVTHSIKLQPFAVPDDAIPAGGTGRRQDGPLFRTPIPLSELSPETLSALCDNFRSAVFQRAGKLDPKGWENSR